MLENKHFSLQPTPVEHESYKIVLAVSHVLAVRADLNLLLVVTGAGSCQTRDITEVPPDGK